MAIKTYIYPPGVASSNPSIGTINTTSPTSATLAGAVESGNIVPLETIDGKLKVSIDSITIPDGIATETTLLNLYNSQLSVTSTGNQSTTPLGANAVFTGSSIDISDFSSINIAAYSDQSSATDGLSMQFSPDGTNWDHKHNFSVVGAVGASYSQTTELRYFRIVYTNGPVAQSVFRLTTILKRHNVDPSRYALAQTLSDNIMSSVTKSVIWGKTTGGGGGGSYEQVKVNPSGALTVEATVTSSSLPTGAATETTLSALNTKVTTTANGLKVDNSAVTQPISAASLPLPTGAATETTLAALNTKVTAVNTNSVTISSSALPTGASTETTLSALNTKVTTTANGIKVDGTATTQPISAASLPLPTGAATETTLGTASTTLTAINGKLPTTLGQTTSASSLSVTIANDQSAVATVQQGMSTANAPSYLSYSATNVTTAAYTQLVASTTAATKRVYIFDSSGQAMILSTGVGGSEVIKLYIPPGGAEFDLAIPAATRVSIKALTGNATSGYILINFLG